MKKIITIIMAWGFFISIAAAQVTSVEVSSSGGSSSSVSSSSGIYFDADDPDSKVYYVMQLYNLIENVSVNMRDIYDENDYFYQVVDFDTATNIVIDVTPGIKDLWFNWRSADGYDLFYGGKTRKINLGVNETEVEMRVSSWQYILIDFSGMGLTSEDIVYVNGNEAWYDYDTGKFRVSIQFPWQVNTLEITWVGYGTWTIENYDAIGGMVNGIALNSDGMDSTKTSVATLSVGAGYYEYGSMIDNDDDIRWNSAAEVYEVEYETELPAGTQVKVALSYYQKEVGGVEFSTSSFLTEEEGGYFPVDLNAAGYSNRDEIQVIYYYMYEGIAYREWGNEIER